MRTFALALGLSFAASLLICLSYATTWFVGIELVTSSDFPEVVARVGAFHGSILVAHFMGLGIMLWIGWLDHQDPDVPAILVMVAYNLFLLWPLLNPQPSYLLKHLEILDRTFANANGFLGALTAYLLLNLVLDHLRKEPS